MRAPEFWYRPNGGILSTALSPAGWMYGRISAARQTAKRPAQVSTPVLCVGNLTVGGAGKTPVARAIADRLRRNNLTVHFLSRGYGGTVTGPARVVLGETTVAEVGDEPLLLAADGPTWISADRAAGAHAAIQDGAEIIVMDDGFQNPGLKKDLSILVFDGADGLGNGYLMPAGPLRETLREGAARADAAVIIGDDRSGIGDQLAPYFGAEKPLLYAQLEPAPEAINLANQRVIAFAGIGRPRKFFETLEQLRCQIIDRIPYPDHHSYRPKDIANLREQARETSGRLVTTTKDAVHLPADFRAEVIVLEIGVVWQDSAAVDTLLSRVIRAGGQG